MFIPTDIWCLDETYATTWDDSLIYFQLFKRIFRVLANMTLKAVLHKQSMWSKHYRAEIVLRNSLIDPVRALECQYFFASNFFTNSGTGRFLGQRMCGLNLVPSPFLVNSIFRQFLGCPVE